MITVKLFTRAFCLAFYTLLCTCVHAQTLPLAPEPPVNTRWVVNDDFTDTFAGNTLDERKWFDYHPRWLGRPPAIFLPATVSVVDGIMQIKNFKLAQDTVVTLQSGSTVTYSIGGGAVVSRKIEAYHGYYEVRMKASNVSMSSTFWMSNPATNGSCPNYSLELDIIETIGGPKTAGPSWATSMKSNTHYYQTDCNGNRTDFEQAGEGPIGGDSSEDFHTYGCWWQDENEMIFYVDGEETHRISANTGGSPRPFDRTMHINMVTETYNWETPPTAAELADDSRNTTYYDYIHAFTMLDVDTPEPDVNADGNLVVNPSFETGDFTGWTGWGGMPREVVTEANAPDGTKVVRIVGGGAPEQIVSLEANTEYTLGATARIVQGQVSLGIKPATSNDVIASVIFNEADWTQKSFTFNTGSETELKFFFFAMAGGNEGFADAFTLTKIGFTEPAPPALTLTESFHFRGLPEVTASMTSVDINFLFKTNETRGLELRLSDEAGNPLGETLTYTALPGYGHKQVSVPLPAGMAAGEVVFLDGTLLTADGETIDAGRLRMTVDGSTTPTIEIAGETVRISPNPASDLLRIEGIRAGVDYKIMDSSGRSLLNGTLGTDGHIDIRALPTGLLFVRLAGSGRLARIIKR